MIRSLVLGALICAAPVAAAAQDYSAPALDPYMSGMQGALIQGTRNGPSRGYRSNARSPHSSNSQARATCANRARAAERMGPNDPQVRELYRLCAQAGYD